jgi:hypothetical protein
MEVRFSAIYAGHALPPGRFLALISFRGLVDPRTIVRQEIRGIEKKKFIGIIWDRFRDFPPFSIATEPITIPFAPFS